MITFDPARVLIADSDPALRERVVAALLEHDIVSDAVSSAAEAIAKLDEHTYGVVLVDVGLAGGDVGRLTSRIAQIDDRTRPVVLALASTPEAARSLDVGCVQVILRKPIATRHLIDVVRSCVGVSTARSPATTAPMASPADDQVTP